MYYISYCKSKFLSLSLSRSLSLHHLCSWCNRKPLKATKFMIKFKQFMHYPSIYKHHPAHCNSTCNQARTVTTVGQVLCTENIQGNCWNDVEHITFTNLIKYGTNWIPQTNVQLELQKYFYVLTYSSDLIKKHLMGEEMGCCWRVWGLLYNVFFGGAIHVAK